MTYKEAEQLQQYLRCTGEDIPATFTKIRVVLSGILEDIKERETSIAYIDQLTKR
jgi:hypothetical protein